MRFSEPHRSSDIHYNGTFEKTNLILFFFYFWKLSRSDFIFKEKSFADFFDINLVTAKFFVENRGRNAICIAEGKIIRQTIMRPHINDLLNFKTYCMIVPSQTELL